MTLMIINLVAPFFAFQWVSINCTERTPHGKHQFRHAWIGTFENRLLVWHGKNYEHPSLSWLAISNNKKLTYDEYNIVLLFLTNNTVANKKFILYVIMLLSKNNQNNNIIIVTGEFLPQTMLESKGSDIIKWVHLLVIYVPPIIYFATTLGYKISSGLFHVRTDQFQVSYTFFLLKIVLFILDFYPFRHNWIC